MNNQPDAIEERILQRDTFVAKSNDDDVSFTASVILNWFLGIIRLCVLIYCLFVTVSHIYVLDKNIDNLDPTQIYNLIFEILACCFVIHDALAAGGWIPGVSNSLFLVRFAKMIPYYSHKHNYRYFTSIPKNYLRAALLLFVASINNSNIGIILLYDIRVLNIALIVFGLCFILLGFLGAIKGKLTSFYVDWILESNKNIDTKRSIAYETNTWIGWISIVFDAIFLLFIAVIYAMILGTISDTLDLYAIVSCVAKCLLSLLIITYLILHHRALLDVNWCSIFILLFSLNASINLVYDFTLDINPKMNEYCLYICFASLFIECIRIIAIIIMYFRSMYRYYTSFNLLFTTITEWNHFWFTRQGISNLGLVLVMFALPFLWVSIQSNWYVVDMQHTPFFDYETPLSIKEFNIDKYYQIFEDIWDEVDTLIDYIKWFDIPDALQCTIILAAFSSILGAGLFPGGGTAAATAYQVKRMAKMLKRLAEMFKKVYDTIKSLVDKIKAIIEKVQAMIKRVQQFVALLNQIAPKYVGLYSVAGLFGLILIPCTTVLIIVYISFLDRSLKFNKWQISAHNRPWFWILFMSYLLLLNIANLLVILSLKRLLTQIFVFETVVFVSEVILLDGYHALFIVHILIIVGLFLFIVDRFLIEYCAASSLFTWSKPQSDMILHSFCTCKANTPSIQQMIQFLVEYYQWYNDADVMTYNAMRSCITGMAHVANENDKVVDIMSSTCWRCIKYKRFKDGNENEITRKDWEYFLTSYNIGNFPWTQPATDRNVELLKQLKPFINHVYSDNDCVEFYVFNEQAAQKEVNTLNVEGCKQIMAHLRSITNGNMEIESKLISDNDLGVKLFLNLSAKQLNELLARFDPKTWNLITAIDVIHDNENDAEAVHIPQNVLVDESRATQVIQSEIEMNKISTENKEEEDELPPNWEMLIDENDRRYYHNLITKEVTWEPPQIVEPITLKVPMTDENDDAHSDNEEGELPEFWKKVTNDGLPYYYHEQTEERQWEKPSNTRGSNTKTTMMVIEETKEEQHGQRAAGSVVKTVKKKHVKHVGTQTLMLINGIFERKIIYHRFFQVAMNDILMESNLRNASIVNTDVSIDEHEEKWIYFIDKQWIKINEILLVQLNRDNGHEDFAPNKFAPSTVLDALNEEAFKRDVIHFASEENIIAADKWFRYLQNALIEYNNNNTRNSLILLFPKQQHFETWCVYIILSALISSWTIYTLVTYDFMSMSYQPTIELDNTVSALIKSKEAVVTEWESVNFDSYFDFYDVSDDQFYDCDIGTIFQYLPVNPLKKFNSFDTFLSSTMEYFTVEDIPLIELLDEIDDFELNGELLSALEIDDLQLNVANFSSVHFPMIDINTWPAITISFYPEWYFMLLFGPIFSFILFCGLFVAGWRVKKFEINKSLIGLFVIFGGFCGLQFVLSLGSILSVVTKYLPHSWVDIKYEYGYYNMILCNIVVMLMGLFIFMDVLSGEHVPLLSRIFDKKADHENNQESSIYHLVQYSN